MQENGLFCPVSNFPVSNYMRCQIVPGVKLSCFKLSAVFRLSAVSNCPRIFIITGLILIVRLILKCLNMILEIVHDLMIYEVFYDGNADEFYILRGLQCQGEHRGLGGRREGG